MVHLLHGCTLLTLSQGQLSEAGLGFLPRIKREAHVNKVVVEIETEQEGLVRPMEKDPTVSRQQINPDNAALGHSFSPGWVKFP